MEKKRKERGTRERKEKQNEGKARGGLEMGKGEAERKECMKKEEETVVGVEIQRRKRWEKVQDRGEHNVFEK
jgi:hypothetical protein